LRYQLCYDGCGAAATLIVVDQVELSADVFGDKPARVKDQHNSGVWRRRRSVAGALVAAAKTAVSAANTPPTVVLAAKKNPV
jgi:hypothetical protein